MAHIDDGGDFRPKLLAQFKKQARRNNAARDAQARQKADKAQQAETAQERQNVLTDKSRFAFLVALIRSEVENCLAARAQKPVATYSARQKRNNAQANTDAKNATYEKIESRLAAALHITQNEIRSRRTARNIVFARQAVMYWTVRLTAFSLPEIGRLMGGRDHTTILHGLKAYQQKRRMMRRYLRSIR